MPTYRSINIALHSQFDIETIPEYHPPPHTPHSSPPLTPPLNLNAQVPPLIDDTSSTASVHIPILSGSQFWLSYSVSPPVPECYYFLFKLYIDGLKVVSWSTGKEEGWRGKMMFGLFERDGRMEKRILCFGKGGGFGEGEGKGKREREGVLEVRVHRASGRRRVEREMQTVEEMGQRVGEGGIRLVCAGRAGSEQPKRFYKFQLIDPVDQPFANFRYYYRSWEQLRGLGLLDYGYYEDTEGEELSVIEPSEVSAQPCNKPAGSDNKDAVWEGPEAFQPATDCISFHDWRETEQSDEYTCRQTSTKQVFAQPVDTTHIRPSPLNRDSIASGTYIPRGAPACGISTGSPPSLRRRSRKDNNRLSFPPLVKFDAPTQAPELRPLPCPQKSDFSSTAYRPHPAYPVEEWTIRTPSPVRSIRDGITTPPLSRGGLVSTGAGLMGAITSTWKRSVSAAQATRKSEMGEGPRSVSY